MVFCWAAISACHALLSSHMTNKDDDDDTFTFTSCLEAPKAELAVVSSQTPLTQQTSYLDFISWREG